MGNAPTAEQSTSEADWVARAVRTGRTGQTAKVLAALRRQWDPPGQLRERSRAAVAFEQLGITFARLDDPDQAIAYLTAARIEYADCKDLRGQAHCLWSLGHFLERIGQYPDAIAAFVQAVQLARDLGDRNSESLALSSLGNCLVEAHDQVGATACFRRALQLAMVADTQPDAGVMLLAQAPLLLKL